MTNATTAKMTKSRAKGDPKVLLLRMRMCNHSRTTTITIGGKRKSKRTEIHKDIFSIQNKLILASVARLGEFFEK